MLNKDWNHATEDDLRTITTQIMIKHGESGKETAYTHALKMSHPRSWMSDQQKFHEFMLAECLSQSTIQNSDVNDSNEVESEPIDPNQLSIDMDQEVQHADPAEYDNIVKNLEESTPSQDGEWFDNTEYKPEEIEINEEDFDFEM